MPSAKYPMRKMNDCVFKVIVFISSIATCQLRAQDVEAILSRHESTRAGLWSLHVKADCYAPSEGGFASGLVNLLIGGQQKLPLVYQCEWIVEGPNEKISYTPLVDKELNGLPNNYFELVFRDGKEYLLENWNRDNPQSVSPSAQGSVRAYIGLQREAFIRKDPGMNSLFLPRVLMNEPRLNLRRLIGRFGTSEVASEDDSTVVIRLKRDSARILDPSENMEVTLAKNFGYLVSCIAVVNDSVLNPTELGKNASRIELRVADFHSLEDGIYFPSLSTYTVVDSFRNTKVKLAEYQFQVVSVNDDIADDVFVMNFPKDVLVIDSSSDPKEVKWFLWGDGNRPAREVDSIAELSATDEGDKGSRMRSTLYGIILFSSSLVVFFVIVCVYFRRRR